MAKGEIVIDEVFCQGCGLCVEFCSRGCIEIPGDKFTAKGFQLPVFVNPEKCTACEMCGWMCPEASIAVYKYIEAAAV